MYLSNRLDSKILRVIPFYLVITDGLSLIKAKRRCQNVVGDISLILCPRISFIYFYAILITQHIDNT